MALLAKQEKKDMCRESGGLKVLPEDELTCPSKGNGSVR
jgi:hypothetical protein